MKKIITLFVLVCLSRVGIAQISWSTGLNEFSSTNTEAKFGTTDTTRIRFHVNNDEKMTLSADGVLKLNYLSSADGPHIVYADDFGNMTIGGPQPKNCVDSNPWYMGGNKNVGIFNTIGTCDTSAFILKSNDLKLMSFRAISGFTGVAVGPNHYSPMATLDVSNGQTNSYQAKNSTRIYGDANGTIENESGPLTLVGLDGMACRVGNKSISTLAFSIDNQGNTRTGRIGVNIPANNNPLATVEIRDAGTPSILVFNPANPNAGEAKIKVANKFLTYEFMVDNTGVGRIQDGAVKYLSYTCSGTPLIPQVWVGTQKPTTGIHASDFRFAVDGKLLAKEVIVTQMNWADFVFDKNYVLPSLKDLEEFYLKNHHLPGVPTEQEIRQNGNDMGETDAILLQKIEELTLYIVEQEKRQKKLQNRLGEIEAKMAGSKENHNKN